MYHSERSRFVIYSDSKSVLESLRKYNAFHPLIQKAQEWLFRISCRLKSVCFCWVPAHVGIRGNELADKEAKVASAGNYISIKKIPHCDMKRPIKCYILKKWQERWSSPLLENNKKYKEIRSSIVDWPSSYSTNRRTEIILSRLRIGHTRMTHQFILESGDPPVCNQCNEALTVKHLLLRCSKYYQQRLKYDLNGKTIVDILSDEADVEALIGFLRETLLFNEI